MAIPPAGFLASKRGWTVNLPRRSRAETDGYTKVIPPGMRSAMLPSLGTVPAR
jgi:hypothetical protein